VLACLFAATAVGGCASSTSQVLSDPSSASSAPGHGLLTDKQFNVAVAIARAEVAKYAATITSVTAAVGTGTETEANVGPPCTSGTLLHIKVIGTFPTIMVAPRPVSSAPTASNDYSVTAVLITADPISGKGCLLSVQTGAVTPDPGATVLFSH
jgi:hypothetical protein